MADNKPASNKSAQTGRGFWSSGFSFVAAVFRSGDPLKPHLRVSKEDTIAVPHSRNATHNGDRLLG